MMPRNEAKEIEVMREMMALFAKHTLKNGDVIAVCTGIVLSQHHQAMCDAATDPTALDFALGIERAFHAVFDQMIEQRLTMGPAPVG